MKLIELIKAIKPLEIVGSLDKEITGINIDSRLIATGHLFIAVKGTQTDGHSYISAAINKEATAIIWSPIAKTE